MTEQRAVRKEVKGGRRKEKGGSRRGRRREI